MNQGFLGDLVIPVFVRDLIAFLQSSESTKASIQMERWQSERYRD